MLNNYKCKLYYKYKITFSSLNKQFLTLITRHEFQTWSINPFNASSIFLVFPFSLDLYGRSMDLVKLSKLFLIILPLLKEICPQIFMYIKRRQMSSIKACIYNILTWKRQLVNIVIHHFNHLKSSIYPKEQFRTPRNRELLLLQRD